MRISTTVAGLQARIEQAAPGRVVEEDGGLFLSAVKGDAARVGSSFLTLYGPGALTLALARDEEVLLRRALRHLSLPLWLVEQERLWWTGLRTLIGPEGAVLFSWRLLGSRPGLVRAIERAGYEIVDSLMTAIDPDTHEVVVHPTRFDVEHGEMRADQVDAARRYPIATIALEPTDYAVINPGTAEFFAKAVAVSIEPTAAADHAAVLEGAATIVRGSRRVLLGGSTIRELVGALDPEG